MLFAFMILQKNIWSLKGHYYIQTLELLFPMLGWMKTEYFGWSGNRNQCQEINKRTGCLPPLGFSSLAFHITPPPDFLWGAVQVSWLEASSEGKGCLWRSLWFSWRFVWVWCHGHMCGTAGWVLDLSRTWKWEGSGLWAGDFLRSWLFTDLYSVMRNVLYLIKKKKRKKEGPKQWKL